jgi:hypothetical protein
MKKMELFGRKQQNWKTPGIYATPTTLCSIKQISLKTIFLALNSSHLISLFLLCVPLETVAGYRFKTPKWNTIIKNSGYKNKLESDFYNLLDVLIKTVIKQLKNYSKLNS